MEILQDKVALDEEKLTFHLTLGSGLSTIDRLNAQSSQQIFIGRTSFLASLIHPIETIEISKFKTIEIWANTLVFCG